MEGATVAVGLSQSRRSILHQANTPSDTTRGKYGIGTIIPNELIREHCHEFLGEIEPRPAWINSNATS